MLDLYVRWFVKRNKCFYPKQLKEELAGLYPGINAEKKIREYYRKKIENVIKFGMLGLLLVILCIGKQMISRDIKDGKYVERNPQGGGDKEITLDAGIGEENMENITITVGEQELSEVEKEILLEEVYQQLEEVIRGENENLNYVTKPLNLITEWEDTQVSIEWASENYGIMKEDGNFGTDEIPKDGISVGLRAIISLDEIHIEKDISIIVFPEKMSPEETRRSDLLKIVDQKEKNTRTGEYMELPVQFEGKAISWKEKVGGPRLVILIPFITIFAVIWGMDQDVHKQYANRNRQLIMEYSEFVSKLQLLIGAGMSTRNAFTKLASDYKKRKSEGGRESYVYEEVMMAVRRLENGAGEEEVLEYFARRCNLACYRKLVSIIIQNQKKGTEGLKESLSTETKNAFDERKQEAVRRGEEAGTKLLLPMMMMMGVVLMIIVIPAYFSFGGI